MGKKYKDDLLEMNSPLRYTLVNEDPVTPVLYFHKLVDVIINTLSSTSGPFGKYKVLNFFKRIDFVMVG